MADEDKKFVDFLVNEVGDELDDGLDELDDMLDEDDDEIEDDEEEY
jgi:hypothetical protein